MYVLASATSIAMPGTGAAQQIMVSALALQLYSNMHTPADKPVPAASSNTWVPLLKAAEFNMEAFDADLCLHL